MVVCADCGADNLPQARTCRKCGRPLVRPHSCPICGAANPTGSRFCNQCGYAVAETGTDETCEPEYAAPSADNLSAGEAPLASPESRQAVTSLTSGLASGLEPLESDSPPSSGEKPRSAEEWTSLLGEPLVSGILVARCLSPEGPGLALATWPMALPAVDAEAGGALLGKQCSSPPSRLKVPKNRRVWLVQ